MSTPVELIKSPPVWGLPSSTPQQISVELYLRVANLPYTTVLNPYPYSTASGRLTPLPLLRSRHLLTPTAPLCLSYLAAHHCDLDEHRSSASRALVLSFTALLTTLDDLLEALLHLPHSPYQDALSAHASDLSYPVASFLRYRRRRHADAVITERTLTPSLITSSIRHVLDAFTAVLAQSSSPFLLSPRPSSIDVLLASYVAYMRALPVDLRDPLTPTREKSHRSVGPWEEPSLVDLIHERPLLWGHSVWMFNEHFPAFASHLPNVPASPPLSLSSPSTSPLTDYHARWERYLHSQVASSHAAPNGLVSSSPTGSAQSEGVIEPSPSIKSAFSAVAPLPVRRGDAWEAEAYAQLSEEEKRARARRSHWLWVIGGGIAVFVFVANRRSKQSEAEVTPTAPTVNIPSSW